MKAIVKVFTECGNSWITKFNGTEQEAITYFLNQLFDIGPVENQMTRVSRIEYTEQAIEEDFGYGHGVDIPEI